MVIRKQNLLIQDISYAVTSNIFYDSYVWY